MTPSSSPIGTDFFNSAIVKHKHRRQETNKTLFVLKTLTDGTVKPKIGKFGPQNLIFAIATGAIIWTYPSSTFSMLCFFTIFGFPRHFIGFTWFLVGIFALVTFFKGLIVMR